MKHRQFKGLNYGAPVATEDDFNLTRPLQKVWESMATFCLLYS